MQYLLATLQAHETAYTHPLTLEVHEVDSDDGCIEEFLVSDKTGKLLCTGALHESFDTLQRALEFCMQELRDVLDPN